MPAKDPSHSIILLFVFRLQSTLWFKTLTLRRAIANQLQGNADHGSRGTG